MASSTFVRSETLQSISMTKLHELEKLKNADTVRKAAILDVADADGKTVRERISALLDGVKSTMDSKDVHVDKALGNIRHWLGQSIYDPSVPETKLLAFEAQLRSYLDRGSRRLDLAHLYARLLTEWLGSTTATDSTPENLAGPDNDGDFEMVEDSQKARLEQLREKFARVVFEPLETNDEEITSYLNNLFNGDDAMKTLEVVREKVSECGKDMLKDTFRLTDESLKMCITAMLKNDLLNDTKKATLSDFLKDEDVLSEIKDVLNMRFLDFKDWNWNAGENGIAVMPRQSSNGKWRVMIDEDVLDGIFTHWIGTHWAVEIKRILTDTRRSAPLWKQYDCLPEKERVRLNYYLDAHRHYQLARGANVTKKRREIYEDTFFLSPLPNSASEEAGSYDDDGEMPTDPRKSPKDVRQLLLRMLATEVIVHRSLDGEVAVVQSDFQWFGTGIAHSTVFAVLRFLGFSEEWIAFFKKFLEPPLNMLDGSPARARKRGLPMAQIFDKVFGELTLYFMDLAVAQNEGMILYRFHDDLWLVGKPQRCAKAWQTMEEFAKVMGLELNKNKTGSVYLTDGKKEKDAVIAKALPEGPVVISFLILDPESGTWIIDQVHVQEHLRQLMKQLKSSSDVLAWIKTWNSCIGGFFSHTFGEPANCLGRAHVDEILKTHRDIQKLLVDGSNTGKTVVDHIKDMLSSRFNMHSIPDSFISMPESLGGLGLKNPFIPLLLLRKNVCKDPEKEMVDFHAQERYDYNKAKKDFESWSEKDRRKKLRDATHQWDDEIVGPVLAWDAAQNFISFEEYTKYRELSSQLLLNHYNHLLEQPRKNGVSVTERLKDGLKALNPKLDGLSGRERDMDHELLWTVQYFEDELFELFGGLEIVDKSLVPSGVLKALSAKKVTWQMNL